MKVVAFIFQAAETIFFSELRKAKKSIFSACFIFYIGFMDSVPYVLLAGRNLF